MEMKIRHQYPGVQEHGQPVALFDTGVIHPLVLFTGQFEFNFGQRHRGFSPSIRTTTSFG
jgi:hypothetical protein